jgi:hypothetical protein
LGSITLGGLRWTAVEDLVAALAACFGRPPPVDEDGQPAGRLSILLTLTGALQRELAGPLEALLGEIGARGLSSWVEVLVVPDGEFDAEPGDDEEGGGPGGEGAEEGGEGGSEEEGEEEEDLSSDWAY